MSTELVIALCALGTALAGCAAALIWFGRQAQRIDQLEKDQVRLEASLENVRKDGRDGLDKIFEKIDKVWEWLHENVTRRSSDSNPG